MSNEATTDDIHSAAAPRSDQLNADSLISGPITVAVASVRKGNKEQPIVIELEGYPGTPWKPNKGMIRILIAGWSDNPHEWVGKRVRLFRNPAVKWAGVAIGGIEISHMSDIPHRLEATKTISKGVKAPFIVNILPDEPTAPDADSIAQVKELWKSMRSRKGESVTKELWVAFVFSTTQRKFDPSKASAWTHDEYKQVFEAIDLASKSDTKE